MPWIDWVLAVVTTAAAASALTRWNRSMFYLSTAALLAQLLLVGPHWQVFPLYAAVGLLAWRGAKIAPVLALLLCCASLAALWVLPLFALPKPTGKYAVGTSGPMSWTDSSRNLQGEASASGARRGLVVQVWYPAEAGWRGGSRARYARFRELGLARSYESVIRTNSTLDAPIADAQFPVLIFGHRWGGSRTQDTFLVEELASHGYVVVAIDHPLNASRVLMQDGRVVKSDRADALSNLEASSATGIEALWAKELAIWTADDQFVLNQLEARNVSLFRGSLDFSRVGAFGHSFGGASSMALLGVDSRVKCAVNLDGWIFQGLDRRTTQPILTVYEGLSAVRTPESGVEGELDGFDNAAVDGSLRRFGGLRAYVAGTQHLDFTDQTLLSPLRRVTFTGPIAGEQIRTITRGLVLGFFDRNLKGIGRIPDYPEVRMERWPQPK
jgi:dienelactone hydrolase